MEKSNISIEKMDKAHFLSKILTTISFIISIKIFRDFKKSKLTQFPCIKFVKKFRNTCFRAASSGPLLTLWVWGIQGGNFWKLRSYRQTDRLFKIIVTELQTNGQNIGFCNLQFRNINCWPNIIENFGKMWPYHKRSVR